MDKTHYFQLCFSEYNGAIPRKRIQKKQTSSILQNRHHEFSLSLSFYVWWGGGGGGMGEKKEGPEIRLQFKFGFSLPSMAFKLEKGA